MRTYRPTVEGHTVQINKVMKELSRAKRPILCVGGGVQLSGAKEAVVAFAEKHRIPVVCTMMGIGVMATDHELFYGMVGNNGQPCGNRAMNEADMIIMAGCRVADRSFTQPDLIMAGKVLVHIDVDPAEIGKNAYPSIPLVGDIAHVFEAFLEQDLKVDTTDWLDTLNGYRSLGRNQKEAALKLSLKTKSRRTGVMPAEFVRRLSLSMDDNAIYVADVGQNQIWSCQNVDIRNGRFLTSGGMGTMGYAVPAMMGCRLAAPDVQAVAVCGDGGFQMTMMELATMKYYGIPCKIVVMKNTVLGLVRQHQHFVYHDDFSMIDIGAYPKLDMLAKAYDMDYLKVEDNDHMQEKIDAFLKDENSVLMEVMVDPAETV